MNTSIPTAMATRLTDPSAYGENRALQENFKWLRANQPLGRAEVENFHPFWVVTKHADIMDVSKQHALFHNGDRPTVLTDLRSEALVRKITGTPHLVKSLVQMDAPEHPKRIPEPQLHHCSIVHAVSLVKFDFEISFSS